jgi:hypothetical protein
MRRCESIVALIFCCRLGGAAHGQLTAQLGEEAAAAVDNGTDPTTPPVAVTVLVNDRLASV